MVMAKVSEGQGPSLAGGDAGVVPGKKSWKDVLNSSSPSLPSKGVGVALQNEGVKSSPSESSPHGGPTARGVGKSSPGTASSPSPGPRPLEQRVHPKSEEEVVAQMANLLGPRPSQLNGHSNGHAHSPNQNGGHQNQQHHGNGATPMDTGTLMPLGPNVVGRNGPRVINPNLGLEAFDNGGVVGGVVGGHVPSAAQSSETPRDSAVHETEQADATLRQADATTMGDVTLRPPQLDLSEAQVLPRKTLSPKS